MKRSMKFVVVSVMLLVGTAFYFTPYYAVHHMRKAAEARDATTLAAYVDFPAFKESLQGQFSTLVAAQGGQSPEQHPFAALGTTLATALISHMIDALVTPESLAMLMRGVTPHLGNASKPGYTIGDAATVDISMAYESVNCFVVTIRRKGAPEGPLRLVLHRQHLVSWKLSALRLPYVVHNDEQASQSSWS